MNVGDYVTAREHLDKLLKQNAKSDYVALRLWPRSDCLTGHVEDSLRRLDEALAFESPTAFSGAQRFRFPEPGRGSRFTELLYPDPGADLGLLRRLAVEDDPV